MAIHRIATAKDDFYIGSAGLSEDQLRASFAVLSNDPFGARLWSVWPSAPHALGASSSNQPKSISIVDGGITYSGLISIAGGRVVVDFNQSSAAIGALNAGDVLTGSFYYVDRLTGGRFSSAKVTFTIRGLNDSATITGTSAGVVTEDVTLTTGGTLTVNDPDAGENLFQNPASLAGAYGTFTFNAATGVWGYTLNNAATNVQSLEGADTVFDSLTVTSLDGSASQTISVSINGDDDDATISGTATGTVTEDGTTTAGGTLTVADVDAGEDTFQPPLPASLIGTYGTFTFNAATGVWGYTLNNAASVVQSLDGTDSVTDTLTVTSFDSSDTQVITVTVNGASDSASISGTSTGSVTEDGTATAAGTLTVTDPDAGENQFQAPAPASLTGTYGTFTFTALTGLWGYTLNNAAANVQGLITGQSVTDSLTVTSLDGSDSETIIVTIGGANDAANITGTATGTVAEDGTLTAGGTLTANDVDSGQNQFLAPASLTGTYGTFTFNAATGVWGYTLNNAATDVQGLNTGQSVTDSLTVTSLDGSDSETIIVTIGGANDPANITGTASGSVAEDGTLTAGGTLNVADVDTGQNQFLPPASLAGTYGTFTFNATTGVWDYTLDNDAANVQGLIGSDSETDTLTVTSFDGSDSETITVTITGEDDPAVIAGTDTGEVTEDEGIPASGALTIIDPDSGEEAFEVPLLLDGSYGTFTFDVDGNWTYTLNDTNPDVDNLNDGDTLFDSLAVSSIDGTPWTINITINGLSDLLPA